MICEEARLELRDLRKGSLDPARRGGVLAHLERCAACARADEIEQALDEALEQRLTRHAAPPTLRRRLEAMVGALAATPAPEVSRRPARRRAWLAVPAIAAAAALVAGGVFVGRDASRNTALAAISAEAINDHLRVLASQRPPEIASGGQHQVKPWFEGKLDFAPTVPVVEGAELRLEGGSVGYFLDRKAAVLVYRLRLHVVTLLVFRADGLPLPHGNLRESSARGFNVVMWRAGDLGYALVSDADARDLAGWAARLRPATLQEEGRPSP
jgi:anti-sigma factor RsiW